MVDKRYNLPIDKGWAWIIMISVMLSTFLEMGLYKSFGIFFVEYVEKFGSNASATSLISGLYLGIYSFAALPILSYGMKRFSSRAAVMLGGLFLSIGYLVSSQAASIEMMYFSQSVLTGLGSACIHGPSLLILGQYFDRRRGTANSMAISFGSLGSLVLPMVFHVMVVAYTLDGALLITSGIILNIVVAGSLLRPLNFYSVPKLQPSDRKLNEEKLITPNNRSALNIGFHKKPTTNLRNQQYDAKYSLSTPDLNSTLRSQTKEGANVFHSLNTLYDFPQRKIMFTASMGYGIDLVPSSYTDIMLSTRAEPSESVNITASGRFTCSVCKVLSPMRNKTFLLLLVAFNIGQFSCGLGHIYIPPYAKDQGLDMSQTAVLVSIIGSSNFVGRIIVGFIADIQIIPKYMVIMVALIVTGFSMLFVHFICTYWSFIIFSIIFGGFSGTLVALYSPVCVESIGLEEFGNGLGIMTSSQGIILGIAAPLLGLLRDTTGSYHVSFYVMGVTAVIAGLLLAFIPFVKRHSLKTTSKAIDL